ncbi:MAG: YmfQ family protein [Lachnospiraceae bacterium]|nr:YmfQ family protein [Lachnospiraceae bacterium]MDE7205250.1 YmfQ family protein [Lachnospiraceae bacterium]
METAIIEYYPQIIRQIKEIQQIARAEDIEFSKLRRRMAETIGNMFIFTANEEGIGRFEKMLGITTDTKQKLDDRRLYLLSVLNRQKMSLSELEKLLKTYADVELIIDPDAGRLWTKVGDNVSNLKLIYNILDGFMPLNISMEFSSEISAILQFLETHKALEMETSIRIRGNVKNAWFLDGSVKLDGSRLLNVELYPQQISMDLETFVKNAGIKSDSVELTSKKDLWFLDGSVKLDGSRLLDAELREEEL